MVKLLLLWIGSARFNWSKFLIIIYFIHQNMDRCRSNLTPGLDRFLKADARVVPGSRPRLGLIFTRVYACRQIVESTFAPSWSSIGQVACPASPEASACARIWAVDRGTGASAPAASRLFVLPVATRRWVLTDNTNLLVFFILWLMYIFGLSPI